MRFIRLAMLLFLSLPLAPSIFASQETVGIIKSVSGEAKLVSNNTVQPAAIKLEGAERRSP